MFAPGRACVFAPGRALSAGMRAPPCSPSPVLTLRACVPTYPGLPVLLPKNPCGQEAEAHTQKHHEAHKSHDDSRPKRMALHRLAHKAQVHLSLNLNPHLNLNQ